MQGVSRVRRGRVPRPRHRGRSSRRYAGHGRGRGHMSDWCARPFEATASRRDRAVCGELNRRLRRPCNNGRTTPARGGRTPTGRHGGGATSSTTRTSLATSGSTSATTSTPRIGTAPCTRASAAYNCRLIDGTTVLVGARVGCRRRHELAAQPARPGPLERSWLRRRELRHVPPRRLAGRLPGAPLLLGAQLGPPPTPCTSSTSPTTERRLRGGIAW